tara:strand:+ start:1740 stop:2405 length:666 start_codon:yes stop_codon:yes gene_type:complete
MNVGKEATPDLVEFCFNVVNKTLFEMSQKRAETDRKVLANMLADDISKRYYTLTKDEILIAFSKGVREKDQMAVNPRTWNNWLREAKMNSNAYRLKQMQDDNKLLLEITKSPEELKEIEKEWRELCIFEPYEKYCEDGSFVITGVDFVYKFFEDKKMIILDDKEKLKIKSRIEQDIKLRKRRSNERKDYNAKTMSREFVLKQHFREWEKAGVNLREDLKDD